MHLQYTFNLLVWRAHALVPRSRDEFVKLALAPALLCRNAGLISCGAVQTPAWLQHFLHTVLRLLRASGDKLVSLGQWSSGDWFLIESLH